MAEEIKNLIDRIKSEGIKVAEDKSKAIEAEAIEKARKIVANAESEAKRIINTAHDSIKKSEDSSRALLKQAARDCLIELKKEMLGILNNVISSHVHKTLNQEQTAKLIAHLLKECKPKEKGDIIVSLKKDDAEKLSELLICELSEELKKGLVLKPSADIHGGFTISYDRGKSYFDFTDKALAEYIGSHIKPKLSQILKDI